MRQQNNRDMGRTYVKTSSVATRYHVTCEGNRYKKHLLGWYELTFQILTTESVFTYEDGREENVTLDLSGRRL